MKQIGITILFMLFSITILYSQEKTGGSSYTQLIGFRGGGEFYISTYLSEWSSGVFFENVISPLVGMEIEMNRKSVPVTNYTTLGVTVTGAGKQDYIEMGGGIKLYFIGISLSAGLDYNNFISGYIIQNNTTYTYMTDQEKNYFSAYIGPELTSQISSDLFTKVGLRFDYGIISDANNYTMGVRFYISFAYGI
jgi:hypothetical protein